MNARKALLLVGSPKGKAGTSWAVGSHLLRKLEAQGLSIGEMVILTALGSPEGREAMLAAVEDAGLVIVSTPLYVDQLPAPLVEALELIAERGKARASIGAGTGANVTRLALIVQCGFPESFQNRPAVEIMRRFAAETGFVWAGALAIGMGGAVGGRSLERAGRHVRSVVKALDAAAASLATGGLIPEEATALAAKPMMPKWLYLIAANFGMKSLARKQGAGKRMYDRPYAP
jgi:hypothetical protein